MTKDELRDQLARELSQVESSSVLWSEQTSRLTDEKLRSAASRALQSLLGAARELRSAIEEIERA
jgi:transcriptional regulator with AAA-type ATPase domain